MMIEEGKYYIDVRGKALKVTEITSRDERGKAMSYKGVVFGGDKVSCEALTINREANALDILAVRFSNG